MSIRAINIKPTGGDTTVTKIECGVSNPRLGGSINLSSFTNLQEFSCLSNDVTAVTGYATNTNLTFLNIGDNQITGTIPSLSAFSNLTLFHCWKNNLTGPLPTFPPSITSVSLHTNQLTGGIPSLSACVSLALFHCFSNQLSGPLPNVSTNINLVDFRCQANQLSGTIPDLGACTKLTTFLCDTQSGATRVTDFAAGGTVPATLGYFQAQNNQLTASAVNALLAAFVAANRTSGQRILNLAGSGNAAPTGQGLTDKTTLQQRGWTLQTN